VTGKQVLLDEMLHNVYGSTDASLDAWFMAYALSARRGR